MEVTPESILTQNFSNCNDSNSESCQDSSFSEVYLNPKWGQIIICNLTILIVCLFSLFICLVQGSGTFLAKGAIKPTYFNCISVRAI